MLILSLLSIVLVMGVNSAYADWQEFNYEVNSKSESVKIFAVGTGGFEPVKVQIFDDVGNILIEEDVITNNSNFEFNRSYNYSGLGGFGKYTAIVTYEGTDTTFDFELIGRHAAAGVPPEEMMTDQKDQDIERLQLMVQKRDTRIAELENKVFDLEKEIDELNTMLRIQVKMILDKLLLLDT